MGSTVDDQTCDCTPSAPRTSVNSFDNACSFPAGSRTNGETCDFAGDCVFTSFGCITTEANRQTCCACPAGREEPDSDIADPSRCALELVTQTRNKDVDAVRFTVTRTWRLSDVAAVRSASTASSPMAASIRATSREMACVERLRGQRVEVVGLSYRQHSSKP